MMDNSTLFFRIHRFRSNACDHGSGPVKAACSQNGVRTREACPFFPLVPHGQLLFAGSRSPCLLTNHVPYGLKFRFPPKVSSPARNIVPRAFSILEPLHAAILFRGGDVVATVNNSIPFFGTTVKFSAQNREKVTTTASVSKRPRRCKSGHGNVARRLEAPNPGVVSKIRGKTGISLARPTWDGLGDDPAAGA